MGRKKSTQAETSATAVATQEQAAKAKRPPIGPDDGDRVLDIIKSRLRKMSNEDKRRVLVVMIVAYGINPDRLAHRVNDEDLQPSGSRSSGREGEVPDNFIRQLGSTINLVNKLSTPWRIKLIATLAQWYGVTLPVQRTISFADDERKAGTPSPHVDSTAENHRKQPETEPITQAETEEIKSDSESSGGFEGW